MGIACKIPDLLFVKKPTLLITIFDITITILFLLF